MKRLCFLLILLLFVSHEALAGMPGFMKKNMGTITGQVVIDEGTPLPGGIVSFFSAESGPPPMSGNIQRVPDFIGRADRKGKFSVKLVPGSYYMGALIITDPQRGPGPPKPGERYFFASDDQGNPRIITVQARAVKDEGTIKGALPETFAVSREFFTVSGAVLDDRGGPFPGAVIMVKTKPNDFRPVMVSQRTGSDGRFSLELPPGTYYLLARQVAEDMPVGRPVPGTFVGAYGEEIPREDMGDKRFGPPPGIELPNGAGREAQTGPPAGVGVPGGVGTLGGVSALPVTGKTGDTISGLTIKMVAIPNPGEIREKLKAESDKAKEEKEGK